MKGKSLMSAADAADVVRLRLASQLDEDGRALDRLAEAVRKLSVGSTDPELEWLRVRALTFELERWYSAVEAVLERALRALDGSVPDGKRWHDELLRTAAVEVPGLRPPLISAEAVDALREVMCFRYFARHGYDREPNVQRTDELAQVALRAHRICAESMKALGEWLRAAAARSSPG